MKNISKYFNYLKKEICENRVFTYFILSNWINAIIVRLITNGNMSIRPLFFDFGIVLLVGSFSFLVRKDRKKLFYWISSFIFVLICIVNSIYYNFYTSYASVSLIATSLFLKDFGGVVVKFAVSLKDWLYLWQFIGLYYMLKNNKYNDKKNTNNFRSFIVVVLFSFAIGSTLPPYVSWSRLIKLWNRISVVDTFGIYMYQIDDMIQSLEPAVNNIFGHDVALKDVRDYYDNRDNKWIKNEYTGILEGKNVIAIHAESLQNFLIGMEINGQEITPNLNRLIKKGMYFNKFYAQVGVGTSSDTEFTYSSSLMPAKNGTVFVNYYNNKYITMQNLLKQKDYYVFSMHGNDADFWNRYTMHQNMGYDNFFAKSSYEIDEVRGLGLSDESFFRQSITKIKEIKEEIKKPFYGTLITLTNHTPWNDSDVLSKLDLSKSVSVDGTIVRRDYLEDRAIGDYIKCVNYEDKAIGEFIDGMEKEGLLDNTVVIIYGDHDARLNKKEFDYMYNYDAVNDTLYKKTDSEYVEFNEYDYELLKGVPLIVFGDDIENKVIDTPMGMIDVLPTIGNMLNIYNKYALGNDIMNLIDKDNLIVFKDGSYLTRNYYYSAKDGDVYALTNSVINENEISTNSEYASKILDVSNNIIVYNLFKDLK